MKMTKSKMLLKKTKKKFLKRLSTRFDNELDMNLKQSINFIVYVIITSF